MLDRILWADGAILALQDSKQVSSTADVCDQFGSLVNEVNEDTCMSHPI